ncbi:hypothetical protein PROFUN_08847 [Planoprotostelium fungivorum]|uniref:Uncharacterized protein n=1 Tax=Planoprotostelium fungivorum TaxID=1890364 RepID=A0A2P6NIX4_9EUKA|nr:hypothetical protein PROFUN_08847 [Planoprotostelium fungivorum]
MCFPKGIRMREEEEETMQDRQRARELLDYIEKYRSVTEKQEHNLRKTVTFHQEGNTKLLHENMDLQEKLEEAISNFETLQKESQEKISQLRNEARRVAKENIESLQTLLDEVECIEDSRALLSQELDEEKAKNQQLSEQLTLSEQVMRQMEIKIRKLEEIANTNKSRSSSQQDVNQMFSVLVQKMDRIEQQLSQKSSSFIVDSKGKSVAEEALVTETQRRRQRNRSLLENRMEELINIQKSLDSKRASGKYSFRSSLPVSDRSDRLKSST